MKPSCLIRVCGCINVICFLFFCNVLCYGEEPINIGSRRELFVDKYLVSTLENVSLKMQTPVEREQVLKFDKPWEGPVCAFVTIIKDGELYRMYYRGSEKDGIDNHVTCYAESKDGINWVKPVLGLYEYNGSKENNIVFKGVHVIAHNFAPFIDTRPGVAPEERYKAVGGLYQFKEMPEVGGLYALVSPDGIHWKMLRDEPIIKKPTQQAAFDSQNVIFWSEAENQYVCYFRIWNKKENSKNIWSGNRWIARSTSTDFLNWSEPSIMEVQHDGQDAPKYQLYTNQTSPYFRAPHIYVAMPARFMRGRQALTEEQTKLVKTESYKDCSDLLLFTSRGGNVYEQVSLEAFLRPGIGYENWVTRTNYSALNIVQTSETEMSFYANRHYTQPSAHVTRYSLRLDGLISLHCGFDDGKMVTKPLVFAGENLYLNYSTSAAGGVRVEVQDVQGNPIEGFDKESCREIIGDEIERKVTWNSNPALKTLEGQPVRLCFYMKDCDIFSIIFN